MYVHAEQWSVVIGYLGDRTVIDREAGSFTFTSGMTETFLTGTV